jgi:Pectate lyase superfamily protein
MPVQPTARSIGLATLAIMTLDTPPPLIGPASAGEAWTPAILTDPALADTYLPDFSYAGYHWGEEPPPHPPATLDVTDFGARADDREDDTAAILKAVAVANAAAGPAVLQFPAGRFIVRDILYLERSDFILRGAGSAPGGTVLEIPIALKDLRRPAALDELQEYLIRGDMREKKTGYLFSGYSWMGGFIWPRVPGKRIYPYLADFDTPSEVLALASNGKRGEHTFTVDSTSRLEVGDRLRIEWYNTEGKHGSLLEHLYMSKAVKIGSRHWENPERPLIFQDVTITALDGTTVTSKEPLLHDLRTDWDTALTDTEPLAEVGIEGLRIEFPETLYGRHHLEAGYNAIYLTSVTHSWVRDVRIVNADNGILSDDASQVTIEDVRVSGRPMHYGVHLGRISGMLAKHLEIGASAQHPLSFNSYAKASVFTDVDILLNARLDQHRGSNHQNLFDNIRIVAAGDEPPIFKHGGASYWRPTHGAFNTLWNIQIEFTSALPDGETIELKGEDEGPHARIVGFSANRPITFEYGPDAYIEGVNRPGISVPSLYQYQLRQRSKR